MTYQGTVVNGEIVLEHGHALPEGAKVTVVVAQGPTAEADQRPPTLRDTLMKFAGCMEGLPTDLAEQHDHYLHGTPKK